MITFWSTAVSNDFMTRSRIHTYAALLVLAAVLIVFLYPTVNLPETSLKRPLIVMALLLTFAVATTLLISIGKARLYFVEYSSPAPRVDLLCARLC